jgi:NTE family protein
VKVVVVFGGGGAKAIAHVGAWRAITEAGHQVVHIVGTSFGAVVGAALAAGRTPADLSGALAGLTRRDVAGFDLWAVVKGIFAGHVLKPGGLRRVIARLVPATGFAGLHLPLTVTTTNLDTGALTLFGAGGRTDAPLAEVLYATCALPVYFPPGVIGGERYADGGLRAVLPLEPAQGIACDLVVAVDVGPGFDEATPPHRPFDLPGLVRAHGEAERIMMAAQTERAVAAWPRTAPRLVLVRAVAERDATFAVEQLGRYLEAGYQRTRQALGGVA